MCSKLTCFNFSSYFNHDRRQLLRTKDTSSRSKFSLLKLDVTYLTHLGLMIKIIKTRCYGF